VRVCVPVSPVPLRTPPTFCAPALTKSRLVPMLSICACTEADAPWPILTIAITAETPMMMPSMVRAARILLRTRARKATRMIIKRVIFKLLLVIVIIVGDDRNIFQLFRGVALFCILAVRFDLAVFEDHHSMRVLRDVGLVRNEHQRDAAFAIQPLKDLHHF